MSLNAFYVTPLTASSQTLPFYRAKVEGCLTGLHRRTDVESTTHAIVALVSRELDSEPRQTLWQIISTICGVLLARTTRECYASLAALHASVCVSIISAVPSYVHDPAICTAAGNTFSTRQLVHYQILAAMRDAWHSERKAFSNGASLRRVTLCAFVDELWCRQAATDRLLYDYLGLLCLSAANEGLELEVTSLCQILLRRGRRLWNQPNSRAHLDELYTRLQAARARIEVSSVLSDALLKLDELQRRGWIDTPELPDLAALKADPEFRAVLSRLGTLSRINVSSRWKALGWSTVTQEYSPGFLRLQLDGRPDSIPSLPKLDSKVDIPLSVKALRLQLSWETLDLVLFELVRWARRCDSERYHMRSLVSALESDLDSDPSWWLLYDRVVYALMPVPGFREVFLTLPPFASHLHDRGGLEDDYADADADADSAAIVRALLDVLTVDRFTSVLVQIIGYVNESMGEAHAETLVAAAHVILEVATEDETHAHLLARLCRDMTLGISDGIVDASIKDKEGMPVKGGLLFRKHLLGRCQDALEHWQRFWPPPPPHATSEKPLGAAAGSCVGGRTALTARHRGLSLIRFVGELFKEGLLTPRIMADCMAKLLSNTDAPAQLPVELACKLMSIVGQELDTSFSTRARMNAWFKRMRDMSNNPRIDSRLRFMLLDVIELRERKWAPREHTTAATTPITQLDGLVSRALGLDAAFAGPKRASNVNPFAALTQNPTQNAAVAAVTWRNSEAVISSGQRMRQRLELTPRTAPREETARQMPTGREELYGAQTKKEDESLDADLRQQIDLDADEFFAFGRLEEGEQHFAALPEHQRHGLVDAIYRRVLKGTNTEATLAGHLFARAFGTGEVTADILEKGLLPTIRLLADIAIDTPNAYALTARMLSLSNVSAAYVLRLAEEIAEVGYRLVRPKDKLLNEFNNLSS